MHLAVDPLHLSGQDVHIFVFKLEIRAKFLQYIVKAILSISLQDDKYNTLMQTPTIASVSKLSHRAIVNCVRYQHLLGSSVISVCRPVGKQ